MAESFENLDNLLCGCQAKDKVQKCYKALNWFEKQEEER